MLVARSARPATERSRARRERRWRVRSSSAAEHRLQRLIGVVRRLQLKERRLPVELLRMIGELLEQHGLAHPAQTGHAHARLLLGRRAQHRGEASQRRLASSQVQRAHADARPVGVLSRNLAHYKDSVM